MAQYPRTQSQITSLADSMIAGFLTHPADFPHADVDSLQQARDEYIAANNALTDAESAAALAANEKLEKLRKLQSVMKNNIKMSAVDCCDDPVKLSQIGWNDRHPSQPISPPGQPLDLKIIAQTDDTLFLSWKKPSRKAGGAVRTYIIQRRTPSQDWQLAAMSLNAEIKLSSQPQGVKLEYQVKAVNAAGESLPSNTIAVVL